MIKKTGFSLAEILISMALASVMMTMLMQHYFTLKQNAAQTSLKLNQSLDIQLTTDFIRERIHKAGFTPCGNVNYLEGIDRRHGTRLSAIKGNNTSFKIGYMNYFTEALLQNNSIIKLDEIKYIRANHPVIISDCYHAEVQHMVLHDQGLILEKPLLFAYQPPIYVGEWVEEEFFIRDHALYYQNDKAEELTSALTNMEVNFLSSSLIKINFQQKNGQKLEIESAVRSK